MKGGQPIHMNALQGEKDTRDMSMGAFIDELSKETSQRFLVKDSGGAYMEEAAMKLAALAPVISAEAKMLWPPLMLPAGKGPTLAASPNKPDATALCSQSSVASQDPDPSREVCNNSVSASLLNVND